MKKYILVPFFMVAMTGASPSGMEPKHTEQVKVVPVIDRVDTINLSVQDAIKLDFTLCED